MLKQKKIEAVIEELARLQGNELNATDMLELRCRVAGTLVAKERHCRFNWSTQQLCENMGLRRFFE